MMLLDYFFNLSMQKIFFLNSYYLQMSFIDIHLLICALTLYNVNFLLLFVLDILCILIFALLSFLFMNWIFTQLFSNFILIRNL